ncbi:transketolase [Nanchangia anserum]|uniref:Transketolase n=1 Tax=Nanchangia anserum TaxID=2692125 RepID=A0A8I0G9K6_9ACTO|nr:transketolase [Nanchangia anserum]MBD3688723.1 transketolase [Nanchangia anserum]
MTLQWNSLDDRAVTQAKVLAADAVEQAGSGHPGTPISLAAAAYLIYQRHLRIDPADDQWLGRDRFVLSAGHASLLQYVQLYLAGMGLELDDLKKFRTMGSATPGHPEYRWTKGIEITTGPLGSGLASAVGFAMAQRRDKGIFDPEGGDDSPFAHDVYVIAGDGCLQEGISAEACSLAGTQELGNLIVIWDDNHISIEDDTSVSFNEDVLARFESYGWHTQRVDWLNSDGSYSEDVVSLDAALTAAKAETTKPSIIALRTIIGWPSPTKQNTGAIHGAKLGGDELRGLKEALGLDPDAMFAIDDEAVAHARDNAAQRGRSLRETWDAAFTAWSEANPDGARLLERLRADRRTPDMRENLPTFEEGKALATRAASGAVLNALAPTLPELWGGSADLAGSNNTAIMGEPSFIPASRQTSMWSGGPYGRNLHFGVREHAMAAIMNGIALDGLTRVYGGTFFVFSDYMRGAVRLAALMGLPVTYVWTHDSIGVGEDGPTHQPVEHLAAYRAIPNLSIVRPADAAETAEAWACSLEQTAGPVGLVLTRQALPNPARGEGALAAADGVKRGAYVLSDPAGDVDVILMGSGSEVQYCLEAQRLLAERGIGARVVSVPCMEWFDDQDQAYRDSVLLPEVSARVSIEAGIAEPWLRYLGCTGEAIAMTGFGQVGSADQLFEHFGFTAEAVVDAAMRQVEAAAK